MSTLKNQTIIVLAILLSGGCQGMISESPTPSFLQEVSATPSPLLTAVAPGPTTELTIGSKVISTEILDCTLVGEFAKCTDETLGIEFVHPATWGEIEAVLRTGWDSGYAYKYSFNHATIPETYLPEAAGLSVDFAEGRDWVPTDFAGFGDSGLLQTNSCEELDLFPICNEANLDVRWMIRFPNAKHFCEHTHQYTSPIFRIEVNLPNNENINGFVFEVPFLSESLFKDVKENIYPLLLFEPQLMPSGESCKLENRQAFDDQVSKFIERIQTNSLDSGTLKNLNDLMHLAESIAFR